MPSAIALAIVNPARASIGAMASDHRGDSPDQNDDVAPQCPIPNIQRVEMLALLARNVTAPADLPQTGQARTNQRITGVLAALICRQLAANHGTRADQSHVSDHDIDQLRQLIDAGGPQISADPGHTRVVLELAHTRPLFA